MHSPYIYSVLSVIVVSLISLIGVFFLSISKLKKSTLTYLVSFSAGALLGDVFIHLLPELGQAGVFDLQISLYILSAIVAFFILEKFIHWHHHHGTGEPDDHATHPFAYLNLIGDGLHNIIDGMIIAGAYLIDIPLGIATTIAVVAHEIPQEIGDFGVLVYGGFSKAKALLFNLLSGLTAIVGALFVLAIGRTENFLNILIALGAGSFIYIATADLIPEIHKEKETGFKQFLAFIIGIGAIFLLLFIE